jgi:mRNA interferase YafQ
MRKPVRTNQFKKDVELARRRGKNLEKVRVVILRLIHEETLDPRHRDHALRGPFIGRRECHLESDWLLIFKLDGDDIIFIFERTCSHSDLFE